jgi:hypothetical protein
MNTQLQALAAAQEALACHAYWHQREARRWYVEICDRHGDAETVGPMPYTEATHFREGAISLQEIVDVKLWEGRCWALTTTTCPPNLAA